MGFGIALIPLCPLLGVLLTYLIGERVKPQLAGVVATLAAGASFLMTLIALNTLNAGGGAVLEQNLFTWFSVGDLTVDMTLRFDQLTAVMCLVITGIGTLIHLYSNGYMAHDEARPRFFSYLNLFMFSMLLLVLGGNLLVLFVGWEGVGLCSYLLIGFWFKNPAYVAAGRRAFVVNRIGDLGFLIGIFLLFREFGTVDFNEINQAVLNFTGNSMSFPDLTAGAFLTLVALSLFIGAAGKSAQIPLFVWLPDAMAGPTPVSALIHAATMVTAGIYMLARLHPIFSSSPLALAVITVVAVFTALIAAITALTQTDIKKVLAYSTVSQLGFMFMAAGAGAYWIALFHVVTHAFFKGCLFLTAGSVIAGCHHEQDMRKLGGLWKYMPITTATYLLSTLAIAGIFPFAGFQSKHTILDALHSSLHTNTFLTNYAGTLMLLVEITAFLTAFYMTRSFALTFLGKYRGGDSHAHHADHGHDDHTQDNHAHTHAPHESPLTMTIPMMILAVLSVIGGLMLTGVFGHSFDLQAWVAPVLPVHVDEHHHAASILESIAGSWIGILGVALGLIMYIVMPAIPKMLYALSGPFGKLSQGKFYFDEIYGALIVRPLEVVSAILWKFFDAGVVDGMVNGTAAVVDMTGEVTRTTETGQVRHYAIGLFAATLAILACCFVW